MITLRSKIHNQSRADSGDVVAGENDEDETNPIHSRSILKVKPGWPLAAQLTKSIEQAATTTTSTIIFSDLNRSQHSQTIKQEAQDDWPERSQMTVYSEWALPLFNLIYAGGAQL